MISYKFGTVLQYEGAEYIFLAATEELVYLGKILNIEDTKSVENLEKSDLRRNVPNVQRMPLFSYVILKTEELQKRAAHFFRPDHDANITSLFQPLNIILSEEDLKNIKEEITKDGCVNIGLRELVKNNIEV